MEQVPFTIIKRDGHPVPFSLDKIMHAIAKALSRSMSRLIWLRWVRFCLICRFKTESPLRICRIKWKRL